MTKEDTAVDDLDLSAELAGLDIDKDFNFISQSTDSSRELAVDTSILEEEQQHAESVQEVDFVEHWKSVLARDEIYSPMYKPSRREVKELEDLVTYLGLQKKGFLQKEDTKWNELSSHTNIVLKRGPVLCYGQERELILLSHGFVLAKVNETPKFALVRIRSARIYDQCDLFDAVEHIRSVPTTVTVIVQEEEEVDEEVAKEDEGEEVVYEEEEWKKEASEVPEEEEMAKEEPEEEVEEDEAAKGKPKEEEVAAPQPTKESPGTNTNRWFGRKQTGEEDKAVAKQEAKGRTKEQAPKKVPKEENKVSPPQEIVNPVEEPEDELDKAKEGENEGDKDQPEEERKDINEGDENLEVEESEGPEDANTGDEEQGDEKDEVEDDVNQDDCDVNQDDNDVVERDEEKRAEDEESEEKVAAEVDKAKEDHTMPEPPEEEVGSEDVGGNAPENHEVEVVAEVDPKKENVMTLEKQGETKAEVKKKTKLVQRQRERYCFVIKTESNEFFLECDTALLLEAWLEAWERVLVQTRSRQRKHRERGWQHALVQTSLHAAAVTGLDDLCCEKWLSLVNELDKYNSLSPLHYAVMVNHMHIMDYLLSHGANPEVQDADGRTPMYYAQRDGLGAAQHLLLEYGAQRSQLCDMEERGELFKGAAQVEAKKKAAGVVVMEKKKDEELKSHHEKANNARSAMADAMNQLKIRGEKISDLSEKTAALQENTKTYGDLAREMKQRAKKKKWYNIV